MYQGLNRLGRLRRRPEFLKVQRQGVKTKGRYLTLFSLPNGLGMTRLGVVATRKHGGAVQRNRAKRLMRELFRLNRGSVGFDVVALLRPGFSEKPYKWLEKDYQVALERQNHSYRYKM